jgi:general stress protein 26
MGLSDEAKIEDILKRASLHAYLGTCDGDQPMVRPVSPIVESCDKIYIATSSKSRKVDQIRRNPKVSLAFVDLPRGEKAATVIGRATVVNARDEIRRLWDLAGFDLSFHFPEGPEARELCFLRILVDQVEWRDRWEGGVKVYRPRKR